MTRAELVQALKDAGFDYLSDPRAQDFVQDALEDSVEELPWLFRAAVATVAATGVTIVGLGPIESVHVVGVPAPLVETTRDELLDRGRDLAQSGPAQTYYQFPTSSPDLGAVMTWPVDTRQIVVSHLSLIGWGDGNQSASGDTDVPRLPRRYHDAIVLRARQLAYEDNDEADMAARMEQRWKDRLESAREHHLRDSSLGPARTRITADWA